MTIIYLDLFTNLIFLSVIGYFVKGGLPNLRLNSPPYLQKFNRLVHRNYWLYALPYFYAISLINDFETLFGIKSYAVQILYFLLFMGIHLLILLQIQRRSIVEYGFLLKNSLGKFRRKFFKADQEKRMNVAALPFEEENIKIAFIELDFLMNSFGLPLLFVLTNSYFLTKILFSIIKPH